MVIDASFYGFNSYYSGGFLEVRIDATKSYRQLSSIGSTGSIAQIANIKRCQDGAKIGVTIGNKPMQTAGASDRSGWAALLPIHSD
jgi:hypothetical protein